MTEHPAMETPGGRLRAARQERDLTLESLSELTKIPPPVLAALEADEYHKVSGALYIKSFMRSCATELGLDPEEILDLYARFSGDAGQAGGGGNAVWEAEEVQITRVGLPWRNLALIGVLVLVVGGLLAFFLRSCDGTGDEPPAGTAARIEPAAAAGTTAGPVVPEAVKHTANDGSLADTLAGAWSRGRDDADVSELKDEAAQPAPPPGSRAGSTDGGDSGEMASPAAQATVEGKGDNQAAAEPLLATAKPRSSGELPLPLVGGPNLNFAGGRKVPVVLRVIVEQPVGISVKCDAEPAFESARWARAGGSYPALPPTGIVAGQVYAVRSGLVVYWGADDHISLKVEDTSGVDVRLNGIKRDVSRLRPGAELLLDLSNH